MENPFEIILARLDHIENLIKGIQKIDNPKLQEHTSEIMTLIQVAEYMSISKSTLYGLTAQREIPHFKRGKKIYFKKSELDQWITSNRVKTRKEIEMEVDDYLIKRRRK
jgi:excisionase family DNA binding protein